MASASDIILPFFFHRDSVLEPPRAQSRDQINPTLLVSWWCTVFSAVIILIRIAGRWVRTERLFLEDKVMAIALIPLFIRMGCVHNVLRYGTNNVIVSGISDSDIEQRVLGSKLVLAARISYAMFLWTAKLTIADFLHRIYSQMWTKTHDLGLQAIRYFLLLTFCGVIVATLAECQPFDHYWQVVPDPGKGCRTGDVQLISMGVLDGITDLILVLFPLPIIFGSTMKFERKISLSLLFSMSLILVGITIYRVQATISHHYEQRFRSLLASFEILAASGVANAIVLGSFLRDRGIKKNKFKFSSTVEEGTMEGSISNHPVLARTRSAQAHVRGVHSWGSDIDLVGDLGIRLGPEFHSDARSVARPAPAVLPLQSLSKDGRTLERDWAFDSTGRPRESTDADTQDDRSLAPRQSSRMHFDDLDSDSGGPETPMTPGGMNFFDVGGLLNAPPGSSRLVYQNMHRRRRRSSVSFAPLPTATSLTPLVPRNESPGESSSSSPVRTSMPPSALKGGRDRYEEKEWPLLSSSKPEVELNPGLGSSKAGLSGEGHPRKKT